MDKTAFALRLIEQGGYYFLSRPRRFGKSLFVDTLKELFEGNQALFEGLYAEQHWDWSVQYPVIRLSFGSGILQNRAQLDAAILAQLSFYEQAFAVPVVEMEIPYRFQHLIRALHQQTGQRVVVLVDEYDKPTLDHLTQPDVAREMRNGLRNLYSVLKDSDADLKFVFFTGVSKFSKVSLFSELNNLDDITIDAEYSALCGYTDEDLDTVFAPELPGLDRQQIQAWYNGYNWMGTAVYNPFDLLLLFQKRQFRPFWFETGLHGILADDMGLGKTIQVIACLLHERSEGKSPGPTLLIAPTSVLGNWIHELKKFAPSLRVHMHHQSDRIKDPLAFAEHIENIDVVITSYGLLRRDEGLWRTARWHRIVADEAQNIKNPRAAQTKALLSIPSRHRLAMTGTPVENRLQDLWSLFHFLNMGYLGNQQMFRTSFEIPIQQQNDPDATYALRSLIEPFVLRRLKSDPTIVQELPSKNEQSVFCQLTKEQGKLYEAVVKQTEKGLRSASGIKRRGLMLATLTHLKQICNHPLQYLSDGSAFDLERSHKLERLIEMLEEVRDSGESALVFSQFRELCEHLYPLLEERLGIPVLLLHGGTSRPKREAMIQKFQDPTTGPAIFILSLKAGGVGINLTRASRVFHIDRWWNPAVEDQATDRAYRIGQTKEVWVHKFVTLGTLEERIDAMIASKRDLATHVLGSGEQWLTELDNDTFVSLIALSREAVLT